MENNLRVKLIDEARRNGSKFGKKAELDFGAGAEWMYSELHKQLNLGTVSNSLPKVCTGCGSLSTKKIEKKYLACCPDNHYVDLERYCKNSVYKPELFNK